MNSHLPAEAMIDVLPCPACGGTAIEGRTLKTKRVLGQFFWYCAFPADGFDYCDFEGPAKATSSEALAAWNELQRNI